jgi:hypothetical protein
VSWDDNYYLLKKLTSVNTASTQSEKSSSPEALLRSGSSQRGSLMNSLNSPTAGLGVSPFKLAAHKYKQSFEDENESRL